MSIKILYGGFVHWLILNIDPYIIAFHNSFTLKITLCITRFSIYDEVRGFRFHINKIQILLAIFNRAHDGCTCPTFSQFENVIHGFYLLYMWTVSFQFEHEDRIKQ